MDLNQLPPDEPLSIAVSHYSVMGSAHPMDNIEDSKVQIEGGLELWGLCRSGSPS